jgi:hypothetical protein
MKEKWRRYSGISEMTKRHIQLFARIIALYSASINHIVEGKVKYSGMIHLMVTNL